MKEKEFLFSENEYFLEDLYKKYLEHGQLSKDWQAFFDSINDSQLNYRPRWSKKQTSSTFSLQQGPSKYSIWMMIDAYRKLGHYMCKLDPLGLENSRSIKDLGLDVANFGIVDDSLTLPLDKYAFSLDSATVKDLLVKLQQTYGSSIGVEFDHVDDLNEKKWLYAEFEDLQQQIFPKAQKHEFLKSLIDVESFENYLHTKFPGAKRFSIEGGEAVILAIEELVKYAATQNLQEIEIGMAHRGRLATLAKVIGKPYRQIFAEFAGLAHEKLDSHYSGDVKYHKGYSNSKTINGNTIQLSLAYNPSHLESVNPVVAGSVRAKQDRLEQKSQILGLLIHGDAAFCGQGVVAESIAMSNLAGYKTYGILHLVINNQIGFTANPQDTRSSRYPTEFAKIAKMPILHVNGDDAEVVVKSILFAAKYRQKFQKDIVVDVFCYRKYGHNEGDEPLYTQGKKYNVIKNKSSCAAVYAQKLLNEHAIDVGTVKAYEQNTKQFLNTEFSALKDFTNKEQKVESTGEKINTGIDVQKLKSLAKKVFSYPNEFPINPKLAKLFEQRNQSVEQGKIDWAIAEMLAFASLLDEEKNIRLSGQDAGRGTFSHRHSVLHSQVDDVNKYVPLNNLKNRQQGQFQVYDSLLSEFAVLGFEYGYSLSNNGLVIWEAQFGDFANGAQTIFDQFISSSESKWRQQSNLVVLLPHGYEGQGPEHSSARIERFLQLAAQDNMQIANPSIPASYFHLLRKQMSQKTKKPLIIFTPKSLLRHKLAVSSLSDIGESTSFVPVIDEVEALKNVARVLLCSGKVYYGLIEWRAQNNITNVAIIRLEQYYPFPEKELTQVLKKYNNLTDFVWCQEEPENMGAYNFVDKKISSIISKIHPNAKLTYIGRNESASPATGYLDVHNEQQTKLIQQALNI